MKQQVRDANAGEVPYPPALVGWYSTVLLALLYWLSILDRTVISLLVDPIKADLGISDVQFGMLHGLAFAVTFSLFGLAAGTLADRFNRRMIIFISVLVWSAATAACGFAKSFGHLLLARVGVGAGEAGLNPCATSMITDLFPRNRLTSALAVYALGASVGAGFAFLAGGILIDMVRDSTSVALPLIGPVSPWQAVFIIIGTPGILVALLCFTLAEPQRRGVRHDANLQSLTSSMIGGYPALLRFMGTRKAFFTCHYLGFGLAAAAFTGAVAWYPAHMGRAFGWSGSQIGLGIGTAMILGGAIGKLLCGLSVDALFRRGFRDAAFLWYGGCLILAVPAGLIATTSASPWIFLVGITCFMILLSPMTAVYVSSLNLVTPNELRGTGVAFYSATVGLLALSLGPILIAVFSQTLYGDAIGLGMATMIGICCPLASMSLLLGRGAMRDAVDAARQWNEQRA